MLNTTNMAFIQSLSQFISSGISYRRDPVPSPYILSTSPPDASMELYVSEHKMQVCSIPKDAIADFCHAIVKIALLPDSRPNFFSITETNDCYTLIVTEEDFQELPKHPGLRKCNNLWRVLTVSVGAMGASNELFGASKIAKSVIGPLADHRISVLCLSTYQSDFVLVEQPQLDDTIKCLGCYFKIFYEDHKRVNCSQILSSSPSSPIVGKTRAVNHPFKSPAAQYHITGLDASKLTGVIQVLLELIFFSGNKEEKTSTFFHFSIVSGDISLMLDDDAVKKFPNSVLYTKKNEDTWRMIAIGDKPLGFEECGIVAQVVEPLATLQVSTYYVSTYDIEYCMVLEKDIESVLKVLEKASHTKGHVLGSTSTFTAAELAVTETDQEDCKKCELEQREEFRPGENMSLGEALEKSTDEGCYFKDLLSTSPLSPTSDDSSYGTSPVNSDTDLPRGSHYSDEHASTSNPIPIPPS